MKQKSIALSNGLEIPLLAQGTYPQKEELIATVKNAYNVGYRIFDTSDNYHNEKYYGDGLSLLENNNDVITITKFSSPLEKWDTVFERSISDIYLGKKKGKLIYLLHWPYPYLFKKIWKWMEQLYLDGRCDAIGVCNFEIEHLEELLKDCRIVPMLNQIEIHPMFQQKELEEYCHNKGIQVMAYSPFARMSKQLVENNTLVEIARKNNTSITKVISSWNIAHNRIVIVGSANKEHIKNNYSAGLLELDTEEINQIDELECGLRVRFNPKTRFDDNQKTQFKLVYDRMNKYETERENWGELLAKENLYSKRNQAFEMYRKIAKITAFEYSVSRLLLDMGINKIDIYGFGEMGQILYGLVNEYIEVEHIYDAKKADTEIFGQKVLSTERVKLGNNFIVITPADLFREISCDLIEKGVDKKRILSFDLLLSFANERVNKGARYLPPIMENKKILITGATLEREEDRMRLFSSVSDLRKKYDNLEIFVLTVDELVENSSQIAEKIELYFLKGGSWLKSELFEVITMIDEIIVLGEEEKLSSVLEDDDSSYSLFPRLAKYYDIPIYVMSQSNKCVRYVI